MPTLRFSAESKDDLKEIARFIANDKPNAARRWVAKIREKCRVVSKHPDIGDNRPELGQNIRSTYAHGYLLSLLRGFLYEASDDLYARGSCFIRYDNDCLMSQQCFIVSQ